MFDFMNVAKALSDENRVRILLAVDGKELCVCILIELLQLAPSTVSKHLSILRQARLIRSRKSGRWMYYRLAGKTAPEAVNGALDWVFSSLRNSPAAAADRQRLEAIIANSSEAMCGNNVRQERAAPLSVSSNDFTDADTEVAMNRRFRILFICQHNSGRSQIAEAYLKKFAGDQLAVESAGLEPADGVNPVVVEVMKEENIDLSAQKPQSVFSLFQQGKLFDHVITVCHDSESLCPVFPGITRRWHWPFPDPAAVEGSRQEKLAKVREIRDLIKTWLVNPGEESFDYRKLIGK